MREFFPVLPRGILGSKAHQTSLSQVLLVAYSSIMQVAAEHGYGQDDLSPDAKTTANYWRTIGQSFSLVATGASKVSVGLFLLRLTVVRWQRIAVYTLVVFMMTTATREYSSFLSRSLPPIE